MRSIRGHHALRAVSPPAGFPAALACALALVSGVGASPNFGPEIPSAAVSAAPPPQAPSPDLDSPTVDPGASTEPVARRADDRPLGPATSRAAPTQAAAPAATPRPSGSGWLVRTSGALVAVLSLIFTLKWALTRLARRQGLAGQLGAGGRAPSGVLEILGRYPLGRGVSLVLLRLDRRVLLLSQQGSGFQTLAEICDPDEVASLIVQTRDDEGASLARRFSSVLRSLERDPAIVGADPDLDLDEPGPTSPRRAGLIAPAADAWPEPEVITPAADPIESLRRRVATLRATA